MIKAVIFDVDGVIFDTEAVWKEAFYKSLDEYNLKLDEDWRVNHLVGVSKDDFINNEQPNFPDIDVAKWRKSLHDYVLSACKMGKVGIKPWVKEIWQFLAKRGIEKAIATGGDGATLECMFNHIGVELDREFPVVVRGIDVLRGKPAPDIFLLAANKLGVLPNECVVLEDSLNGVRAGVSGGFNTIMVLDQVAPNDFARVNCLAICDNMENAQKVIEELL